MASEAPEHLHLTRLAQRDLDGIPPQERTRLIHDLLRLAQRALPGEIKPIASLPGKPLQADSGRFRILHLWESRTLWILTVFARPNQRSVFRGLRKQPRGR
ncbi:MAG: hypothetical protein HYZ89_08035 [Candidatus Omnitrophica bacterium]|nr:hypothetical protein [Candidatus Omnitrophota bacterium]